MKAFHLPTVEDILRDRRDLTPEEAKKKIEDAITKVEEELGEPIRNLKIKTEIELGNGIFDLGRFPVRGIKVEGTKPNDRVDVDEDRGLIFAETEKGTYLVSYQVGYEDGKLPATLQMAIEKALDDQAKEDFEILKRVWSMKKNKERAERDVIKTHRTV